MGTLPVFIGFALFGVAFFSEHSSRVLLTTCIYDSEYLVYTLELKSGLLDFWMSKVDCGFLDSRTQQCPPDTRTGTRDGVRDDNNEMA